MELKTDEPATPARATGSGIRETGSWVGTAARGPVAGGKLARTASLRWAVAAATALALGPAVGLAQEASFVARADRGQVALGDSFIYEVTLSLGGGSAEGFRAPDFRGVRVLGEQPSQSTQIQMGGGQSFMQTVYSWRYELEPLHKGVLTIGPARVRVAGRDLKTTPVTLNVGDGATRRATRPGAAPAEAEEGANFLRVVASKNKAFVGEQITVSWSLYLSQRPHKYQPLVEPRLDGFWVEDLPIPTAGGGLALAQETFEGRAYLVGPLLKKAVFALGPGRLAITPLESEIARVEFFGTSVRSARLKSDTVVIEAVPLPAAGRPAGFDPAAVGRFNLAADLDRTRVAVGEAVTLVITVSGHGNLRKLVPPTLARLDGWKIYEPKITVELDGGERVGGRKKVEHLLLPERAGEAFVPEFALAYFDPESGGYATARSAALRIEVLGERGAATGAGGAGGAPGAAPAHSAPGGVENVVALDIRPIKARASLRRELGATLYRSRVLEAIVVTPPLAFAVTVAVGRVRGRWSRDSERTRRRKVRRLVRRHFSAAEDHLRAGRSQPFFGEIDRVLRESLSGKLGRPVAGLARDEMTAALGGAGLDPDLAARVLGALDECDRARFAPGDASAESMQALLDRADEIVFVVQRTRPRPGTRPA